MTNTYKPWPNVRPEASTESTYALRSCGCRSTGRYDSIEAAAAAGQPGDSIVTARGGWIVGTVEAATPTDATITLSLSEYEASILTGALAEFGERWQPENHTASYLRERIAGQCPDEWEMS